MTLPSRRKPDPAGTGAIIALAVAVVVWYLVLLAALVTGIVLLWRNFG